MGRATIKEVAVEIVDGVLKAGGSIPPKRIHQTIRTISRIFPAAEQVIKIFLRANPLNRESITSLNKRREREGVKGKVGIVLLKNLLPVAPKVGSSHSRRGGGRTVRSPNRERGDLPSEGTP